MVNAIACLALQETVRHGAYLATFRGFCIEATRRKSASDPNSFDICLWVRVDGTDVARARIKSSDLCMREQSLNAVVI